MTGPIAIEALPLELSWHVEPAAFSTGHDSLRAEAGAETDLLVDPGTRAEQLRSRSLQADLQTFGAATSPRAGI